MALVLACIVWMVVKDRLSRGKKVTLPEGWNTTPCDRDALNAPATGFDEPPLSLLRARARMSKKRQFFGTDGVRGAGECPPMTPEFVMRLGQAAAKVLARGTGWGGAKPVCIVGRDTRVSGEMLESALVAGLNSMGVDAVLCGVVPTPAVAFITAQGNAAFGAVVSASHNPFHDNGIKFVGGDGYKLSDDDELADRGRALATTSSSMSGPAMARSARVSRKDDAAESFIAHAVASMQGRRLDGMRIALDNANGASCVTSTETLRRLGAQLTVFHSEPNGVNINHDCGCTHAEVIEALVTQSRAQVGIAHDGDADRVVLCDETGSPRSAVTS